MATSGVSNFNLVRNQIIDMAFGHLNIAAPQENVSPQEYQFAVTLLNALIVNWQIQGHLWLKKEAILFIQLNQSSYPLGDGTSHVTHLDDYIETELSADEASGQTTLSVTSSAGMTINDHIGIELNNGYLHWSTISGIPTPTSVTIADALTDAADENNVVYTYTNTIPRPLDILSCRRNDQNDIDTPMFHLSHQEYFDLPNKAQAGTPTSWNYDPQLNTGVLRIWQPTQLVTSKVKFTFASPVQNFVTATNDPDFPPEWLLVIGKYLALQLAPRYGKRDNPNIKELAKDAALELMNTMDFDNEDASTYFAPSKW